MTELADTLARIIRCRFAPRTRCGRLVQARTREPNGRLSVLVAEISRELLGEAVTYTDEELMEILSPRHFVNVRRTHGGPAPEVTARAAADARVRLDDDRDWWDGAKAALNAAERRLADRSALL